MKKTLITLLALSSLAIGEELSTPVSMMPTSYDASTDWYTAGSGWQELKIGWADDLTALGTNLATDLPLMGLTSTSTSDHYFFNHKGQEQHSGGELSFNSSEGSLTLTGRSGGGRYVFFVTDILVSDLLDGKSTDSSIITLNMTSTAGTGTDYLWGLYKMNSAGEVTALSHLAAIGSNNASIGLSGAQMADLTESDKLISIVSNRTAGGTFKISELSYTVAAAPTPAVPEPTTATLSLLALAGLAARRRRK